MQRGGAERKKKVLGFKHVKDDPLYNRRRWMVVLFVWAVFWGFLIWGSYMFGGMNIGAVSVFLGYVATISALPTWSYVHGASKGDK